MNKVITFILRFNQNSPTILSIIKNFIEVLLKRDILEKGLTS